MSTKCRKKICLKNETKTTGNNYADYLSRQAEREQIISRKITNFSDPLQAIPAIVQNEGSTLRTIWESDSGYPFDEATLLIILIPVFLGIIGNYVASQWEPHPTGEELYDDFGNRIVEYPKMPIAYLQQTSQDMSATRENRNSLAWLCHKWLISTNDVVQELQAPYPLERSTLRTIPEETGRGKVFARGYEQLLKAAQEWKLQLKRMKKDDLKRRLDDRKAARPLHTLPHNAAFRKAPLSDVRYLEQRIPRARKLWKKLNQWAQEYADRNAKAKFHPSDVDDSYWSSSETFSSDSGEHWKSYKGEAKRWAKGMKLAIQWKLDKARKLHDKVATADAARRQREATKAANEAILAAAKERKSASESAGTDGGKLKKVGSFLNVSTKSRNAMKPEKAFSSPQVNNSRTGTKPGSEKSSQAKGSKSDSKKLGKR